MFSLDKSNNRVSSGPVKTLSPSCGCYFSAFCTPGRFLLDSRHLTFTFCVLDVLFSYKHCWALFWGSGIWLENIGSLWVLLLRFVRQDQGSLSLVWRNYSPVLKQDTRLVNYEVFPSGGIGAVPSPAAGCGLSPPLLRVVHLPLVGSFLTYSAGQYFGEYVPGAFCRYLESPLSKALSSLGLLPVHPCCSVSLGPQFCLLCSGLLPGAACVLPLDAAVWELCQSSRLGRCGITRSLPCLSGASVFHCLVFGLLKTCFKRSAQFFNCFRREGIYLVAFLHLGWEQKSKSV